VIGPTAVTGLETPGSTSRVRQLTALAMGLTLARPGSLGPDGVPSHVPIVFRSVVQMGSNCLSGRGAARADEPDHEFGDPPVV
jgi:hypothetical protein